MHVTIMVTQSIHRFFDGIMEIQFEQTAIIETFILQTAAKPIDLRLKQATIARSKLEISFRAELNAGIE